MTYSMSKLKIITTILLLVLIISAMVGMAFFYRRITAMVITADDAPFFSYHYVMISDAPNAQQWLEIWGGASETAQEFDAYLENWGAYLQQDFDLYTQITMAIAANVDGIILSGPNNTEIAALINEAIEEDIPVITMITDVPASNRNAFVSFNDYAIGRIFGQQLIDYLANDNMQGNEAREEIVVTVLIDTVGDVGLSGMIYRGIFEAVRGIDDDRLTINSLEITRAGEFETEEKIRDLFLNINRRPDILIALNATNTIIAMQSLIEYNLVGQINILGTSVDDTILEGVSRGLIYSTVFINERKMGQLALATLHDNVIYGESTDYETVAIELITRENLEQFIREQGRLMGEAND